jgi:transcriptional regulator with XRE-family HTH domain
MPRGRRVSAAPDTERVVLAMFGTRIRELRNARGLSQEDLAHLANLHRTYVGSIERGERNVALINIHRLAAALNVPAHELLRRE